MLRASVQNKLTIRSLFTVENIFKEAIKRRNNHKNCGSQMGEFDHSVENVTRSGKKYGLSLNL